MCVVFDMLFSAVNLTAPTWDCTPELSSTADPRMEQKAEWDYNLVIPMLVLGPACIGMITLMF